MHKTPEFSDLLRLIDERSTAFRAAVASAPDLDVPVPTCPGWTVFDLVRHLGEGRRNWAATVAAGPGVVSRTMAVDVPPAPREREALLEWMAASTRELLDALREAGPDRGCWVGWGDSQSPATCGAVARHQVQEIAVHTYDAQLAAGAPRPLPEEVAVDGVEEFQFTCCATTSAWPHDPAVVDYHVTEGRSWRLRLSADGARVVRLPAADEDPGAVDMSARASASDLVLAFYGRVPADRLEVEGDVRVLDQLVAWEPE
ncbi:maleylpyruvate isomerase family mycothiol-dependent enzyme [Umezawaea endophytica]|uniref:Maleylpyruvate isomerase N-terminal domain-containing protein n=1 Tax=Umezawaea endophytica TaxID=1654476 RepID=A0A9X2VNH8_9PSEU|nr:maleylpyruvate isomerase family mycothiol-dependent enzyme [Umezawaea endophytica]MCS7479379.1 maleylpyruvate isomerase N-terminal domain-containing protein [Umezawaea endophytica]